MPQENDDQYDITTCVPAQLSQEDLSVCLTIVKKGDAVDPESAAREIPRSQLLAVARRGSNIVGVGAIKRLRRSYAEQIASVKKSGVFFPPDTPELGYVAVDEQHRGHHLGEQIVSKLIAVSGGSLFATTDHEGMKRALSKTGFSKKGREWVGQRGTLSFWWKD